MQNLEMRESAWGPSDSSGLQHWVGPFRFYHEALKTTLLGLVERLG